MVNVEKMQNTSILNKVEKYARVLLNDVSSEEMLYHNLNHTLEVVEVATEIAVAEGLTEEEIELIKIAAWFHDTGYLKSCEEHEEQSASYADEFLKKESYPYNKIEKIIGCIIATKVPQSPKNKMEEVLCDADLHHLGLPDIKERGSLLRREVENRDLIKFSDIEWLKNSSKFFRNHKYFTNYAKKKFNEQKALNLINLENDLQALERTKK